jgi:hypothetical protein
LHAAISKTYGAIAQIRPCHIKTTNQLVKINNKNVLPKKQFIEMQVYQ